MILFFYHSNSHFLYNSLLHHIVSQFRDFVQQFHIVEPVGLQQKAVYSILEGSSRGFDFHSLLRKRLVRHFSITRIDNGIPFVLALYKKATKIVGFAPVLSHLRAMCNHWCTYSRFGNKRHDCLFNCGHITDQIAHTIACTSFWDIFFAVSGVSPFPIDIDAIVFIHVPHDACMFDKQMFILLGCHICFLTFHDCKHGSPFSSRRVLHHLFSYTRCHYASARLIRRLKFLLR